MRKSPKQRNPSIIHHPQVRKRLGPGTSLAALSGDHFNRAPDDFTRANLTGANLTGANLIWAKRRNHGQPPGRPAQAQQRRFRRRRIRSLIADVSVAPTGLRHAGLGPVAAPESRACFQEFTMTDKSKPSYATESRVRSACSSVFARLDQTRPAPMAATLCIALPAGGSNECRSAP